MGLAEPPSLLTLRREVSLRKRVEQLRREAAITFFKPHPGQVPFFEHANYKYRYARTGNRFGKSEMGSAEDVAYALGERPWYPKDHPLRTLGIPAHPTKGLIVCTTWKKSREVFTESEQGNLGKLFKYIPASALGTPSRNHSGFIDRIPVRHKSGDWSVIMLDTIEGFKNNALAQESSVHDWCHIDEPIPIAMWKAIARGLVDRQGSAWFTCTPLTEPWLDEAFTPDLESDRNDMPVAFSSGDRYMMTGTMHDNPHNSKEAIASFLSWLTDDEKECRINGLPTSFAGLVYKEFSWNLHVLSSVPHGWRSFEEPPSTYTRRFAIDYHFRKNDAVLFIATSPQGFPYVYHELWDQMLLGEEVQRINSIHGDNSPLPGLVDPLASTPNKINETNAMDEYRRLGLPIMPATKDPVNGVRAVKALLKERNKDGGPCILFSPNCKRTLFEMARGFVWDGEKNAPKKINDDMMENLYRLILQGLDYVEPSSSSDYTNFHGPLMPSMENILSYDFGNGPIRPARSRESSVASRYSF